MSKRYGLTRRRHHQNQHGCRCYRPTLEALEDRCLLAAPIIDPLQVQLNLPAAKTLQLPVSATDPAGGSVAYTLTAPSSSPVTVTQRTGPFLLLSTPLGNLEFQLFSDLTPQTTALIGGFIKSEFYNGLTFHRIVPGSVVQGGDPLGTGLGGPGFTFDDEFNPDLIYSGNGQLALANSGPDSNGSQFFISAGPQRGFDFNNPIFGQLVRGFDVLSTLDSQPNSGPPKNTATPPITITSMQIVQDTTAAVFTLKSTANAPGPVTLTLKATSSTGGTTTENLTVNVQADATNDPAFLSPLPANQVAPPLSATAPFTLQLNGQDLEGDALDFEARVQGANANSVTVTPGTTNGSFVISLPTTATSTFQGPVQFLVGVRDQGATSRGSTTTTGFDTHVITIAFGDAALSATRMAVSASEGAALPTAVPVATFTDGDNTSSATDFTGSINWGDGTPPDLTTAATPTAHITGSAGHFTVTGTHTYKEAGTFPVRVLITDTHTGGDGGGATATATATATVSDAALPAAGIAVQAVPGKMLTGVPVANFTDADPKAVAADFTASITWGDNTPASSGLITPVAGGGFQVTGNHTYQSAGSLPVQVVITDVNSAGDVPAATAAPASTATVAVPAPVAVPGTPNQRFVTHLYRVLLNRVPDPGGLAFFSTLLDLGLANRYQVTLGIDTSLEHRIDEVVGVFQTMLNRYPDLATGSWLVNLLGNGYSLWQVQVILANTPEYFLKHGGTTSGFVTGLFHDGLQRGVDPGGMSVFTQAMTSGITQAQIATVVFTSLEWQVDQVQGLFEQFLNRPAEAAAQSAFLHRLQQDRLHDELITLIIGGSPEFFGLA